MISQNMRTKALALARRKLEKGEAQDRAVAYLRSDQADEAAVRHLMQRLRQLPDLDSIQRRRTFPAELRETVVADHRAGMPQGDVARKYGVSPQNVNRWVLDAAEGRDRPKRWNHHDEEIRQRAREEYAAGGITIRQLAVNYNVAIGTMSEWCATLREEPDVATRQSQAMALVRECEKAEWETEYSGDGVKVFTPEGPLVIHLTPSDSRSLKNLRAELERRGLSKALEAVEERKEKERREKLAADAAAADVKTAKLLKRSNGTPRVALQRAAGAYLVDVEDAPLDWFTQPHPAPWHRWVAMTPTLARYLLEFHNKPGKAGVAGTNRPQSESRIRYYVDVIVSGQWLLTHQGMAMDRREPTPMVQDGQHRLAAIDLAGDLLDQLRDMPDDERERLLASGAKDGRYAGILKPGSTTELVDELKVPVSFYVGMPEENFAAIDDVLLRNASQLFTQAGEKNGGTLASAARLIHAYRTSDPRQRLRRRITNQDTLAILAENGGDQLRKAASLANSHARKKASTGVYAFAAAHYLLGEANGHDNVYVKAFFDGVLNGYRVSADGTRVMLDDDDPRQALRVTMQDKLQQGKMPRPIDQLGIYITAWNMMVNGRHKRRITWYAGTSEIPKIDVCPDKGPNASAPPRALGTEVFDG